MMKQPGKLAPALAGGIGAVLAARAMRHRAGGAWTFRGRSALITGGSRGLGLALARELADEGARLAILARDEAELERARQDLAARGAEVLALTCDVRKRQEVEGAIARIVERYGGIDVLVNNAGIMQFGPVEHMALDDFEEAMAVHAWAPLYAMQAAIPHMRRQGGGRIVNIASIGGKVPVPHMVPYAMSKFALVGLSDGMRTELAKDGIRVTTVCPGLMRTGSHLNATFKGQHRREFTAFALAAALPVTSMDARRAARQIVAACRHGRPHLTTTVQARLLILTTALAPSLVARAMELSVRFLPGPTGADGDRLKDGWESTSRWAPSPLTRLADRATARNNELRGHPPPS